MASPTFQVALQLRDATLSYSVTPESKVEDFFEEIAPLHHLEKHHHFLANENGTHIQNDMLIQGLIQSGSSILVVMAKETSPLLFRAPFLKEPEMKKAVKLLCINDSEVVDSGGRTLAHHAAFSSSLLLKTLVKKKLFATDVRDHEGNTPLMYAARNGHVERMQTLLAHGDDMKAVNTLGETCLHHFCKNNDVDKKKCRAIIPLLQQHGVTVYSRDNDMNTPAHTAARYQNRRALEYFVEKNHYQLELPNKNGSTCLHLAIMAGDTFAAMKILGWNAPMYVADNEGKLPLDLAEERSLLQLVSALSSDISDKVMKEAWDAVRDNEMEKLKKLNASFTKTHSKPSIMGISQMSSSSSLARSHAGTGKRGFRQTNDMFANLPHHRFVNVAIAWAAVRLRYDMISYLLDTETVNFNFQNSDGSFLLYLLCSHPSNKKLIEVAERCVDAGAGVNSRNIQENTCLHTAAIHGNIDAVKFLLDRGAFPNSMNMLVSLVFITEISFPNTCLYRHGLSELHYAIIHGNSDIINEMFKSGADNSYLLKDGTSVQQFANFAASSPAVISACSHDSTSECRDLFQPNIAVIKVLRGEDLLAKDESGFSDPYCILTHRLGDKEKISKTTTQLQTLHPTWDEEFTFIVKSQENSVYYRDIILDVFDWDEVEDGDVQPDDYIGSATLVLDPRSTHEMICLELRDQRGKAGNLYLSVQFTELPAQEINRILSDYEARDVLNSVKSMLRDFGTESVGQAKARAGFSPKYPVMIIPGLASSALEAWESPKSAWIRERVWLDPFKIGQTALGKKVSNAFGKKSKTKKKKTSFRKKVKAMNTTERIQEEEEEKLNAEQRIWLQHILCASDGYSDPPGIKLRPCTGLAAIDFLATGQLSKAASYVFGHVLKELANVGYTSKNLDACPYDWRLPPQKLEERDGYFSSLKMKLQLMRELNGERVVVMCHSMGNRCFQYFLQWMEMQENGQVWIDQNIHAFFALGPPFLGAPKTVRSVVSGDQMGLDIFLTPSEGRILARNSGSLPWLFPIQEDLFPDTIAHMASAVPHKSSKSRRGTIAPSYTAMDVEAVTKLASPSSHQFFENFYLNNPLYLNGHVGAGKHNLAPIIQPPPVENLWVLYGTNLNTEVSYYFKPKSGDSTRYVLDTSADAYSSQKIGNINPRGLMIQGGIGYEHKNTFQPSTRANKSGDGTVPYCSLNYATFWKKLADEGDIPLKNVTTVEIEGADHREMLNNPAVFESIIHFLCEKPIG